MSASASIVKESGTNLRICYVVWTWPKLSETFVATEIEALVAMGHEVRVATLGAGDSLASGVAGVEPIRLRRMQLSLPKLRDLRFTDPKHHAPAWCSAASRVVAAAVEPWRPHVVHAHFADRAGLLGILTAKRLRVPATVTAHAVDWQVNTSPRQLRQRLHAVDRFFAISDEAIDGIVDRTGDPGLRDKGEVIRASASKRFDPGGRPGGLPQRYAATVARLIRKKGVDLAIRMLTDARLPDEHLCIVGDGPESNSLRALAAQLGLRDRVHFLGALSPRDAQTVVSHATALVLPCRNDELGGSDGIPVVLMEAGLLRVPVITTPVGGIAELVVNGEGGLVCAPEDPHALAGALASLLASPALCGDLARSLLARVETEFSPKVQAQRLTAAWTLLR